MARTAMTVPLGRLLGLEFPAVVVFVGGGGKSTLIDRLAQEVRATGGPLVITTTTKMGTDQVPGWAIVCRTVTETKRALSTGPVFLLGSVDAHKVVGVAPRVVDEIANSTEATILVEGDGARRRPFKAPGPGEPVIPSTADLVAHVAGIDAIGAPVRACHRPERVAALTGRDLDDELRPRDLAAVLNHPEGGGKDVPASARRLVVLTKVAAGHDPLVAQIREALDPALPLVTVAAG